MKKLGVLVLVLFSPHAFACGPAEFYFEKYWRLNNIEQKTELLDLQGCGPQINYYPRLADPVIAKAVVDAIQIGIHDETIEKVLKNFNCAYGARHEPEYETIRQFITDKKYSEFCNVERLTRIFIVTAQSGAILRAGPSVNTERLYAIRDGDYVEMVEDNGDWLHVKSIFYGEGYIHRSLLSPY
jgi:hypothetical protein